MVVIKRMFILNISFVFFYTSCLVKKPNYKCVLVYETNTIYGYELNQKVFYDSIKYVPLILEDLINNSDEINNTHFSRNSNNKYAGYRISGCRDTTWAKQTMAAHLMKKYNVERFDSVYLDTVYRLEVIDESRLIKSPDSCIATYIKGDVIDGIPFNHYKCIPWGPIAHFTLPYNSNTNSIDVDLREGNYDLSVPREMDKKIGVEYYSKTFLEPQGMSLRFERIDTIHLGVYRYRDRKYDGK